MAKKRVLLCMADEKYALLERIGAKYNKGVAGVAGTIVEGYLVKTLGLEETRLDKDGIRKHISIIKGAIENSQDPIEKWYDFEHFLNRMIGDE